MQCSWTTTRPVNLQREKVSLFWGRLVSWRLSTSGAISPTWVKLFESFSLKTSTLTSDSSNAA